ncbi:related to TfdA family oxidoreductase [Cephalotrichum gorgonifer]|uniref:Related to TfdA family oxidoreductase n=1 Tax=Cephalotrichum gorgonifer TaxID=2041049 RepID=A0AAE8SS45_9PEZI|nr:related to TfdA family oxidoreductase [Cephalotrichum gorgonifer]
MTVLSTLGGPLLWTNTIVESPERFTLHLGVEDITEIENALVTFKAHELDGNEVSIANFPLPKLMGRLSQACKDLHNGKGFFVISGLDIDAYSVEDSVVIYLGLASYIGDQHGLQNRGGDVLTHVTDSKLWTVPKEMRHGIHSNRSLPFHSDMGSDVLCLQVRECAQTGGGTHLASSWSIYNDLVREKPEVIETLFSSSWPIQVSGSAKYILAPLMQVHEGKLLTSVDPGRLGPHSNSTTMVQGVPKLSSEQEKALDALLESAKQNEIRVPLQKGDMLFVNNWAILHRRESYEDAEASSRHLVRLWIRNTELGWAIPENMAVPWKASFERMDVEKVYNVDPIPVYKVPKYSAGSAAFLIDEGEEEKEEKA